MRSIKPTAPESEIDREWLYRRVLFLSIFTVLYNLVEGLVSVLFGVQDETLTLFGFGLDSFIECLSGLGILVMVTRIRNNPKAHRCGFERTALRVTAVSFFLLAAGLSVIAIVNIASGHRPETTVSGVIIALISIAVMIWLVRGKTAVGNKLGSEPIIADAGCTRVCIYMSLVLLAASGLYWATGIGYIDSLGALGLAWFAVREGREAWEQARREDYCRCGIPSAPEK